MAIFSKIRFQQRDSYKCMIILCLVADHGLSVQKQKIRSKVVVATALLLSFIHSFNTMDGDVFLTKCDENSFIKTSASSGFGFILYS